jgi:hypothetical protein
MSTTRRPRCRCSSTMREAAAVALVNARVNRSNVHSGSGHSGGERCSQAQTLMNMRSRHTRLAVSHAPVSVNSFSKARESPMARVGACAYAGRDHSTMILVARVSSGAQAGALQSDSQPPPTVITRSEASRKKASLGWRADRKSKIVPRTTLAANAKAPGEASMYEQGNEIWGPVGKGDEIKGSAINRA